MDTAKRALADRGNPTPALDARLLLQHAAGLSHEALITEPEQPIPAAAAARFHGYIARRLGGAPVSRIVGRREFYGRSFAITEAVLDPRPDTETLIEAALAVMPADQACRIIDLGTGSGIIGVTLLAERPHARGVMTDLSAPALAVARGNARRHGVSERSSFIAGSWFAGAVPPFDLVLSNPPYIRQAILQTLAPEVRNFDPKPALDGGPDGLRAYREIAAAAGPFLASGGRVIVEIGEGQAVEIEEIFKSQGFDGNIRHSDLAGHVRCILFTRGEA